MNKEVIKKNLLLALFCFLVMAGCSGYTEDWVAAEQPPEEPMNSPYQKACVAQSGKILAGETDDSLVFVFNNSGKCPHDEALDKWDANFFFADTVKAAYSLSGDTLSLSFDRGSEKGEVTIMLVAESKLNGCLLIGANGCDRMKTGAGRLDGEWKFLPCAYINGERNCENSGRDRFMGFDVESWNDDAYLNYRVENYYSSAIMVQSGVAQVDVNTDSIFFEFVTAADPNDENILFDDNARAAYSFSGDTLLLSFNVGHKDGKVTMMLIPNSQVNGCIDMNPHKQKIVDCSSDIGELTREWKILPCTYIDDTMSCDSDDHERFLGILVDAWEGRLVVSYKKEP